MKKVFAVLLLFGTMTLSAQEYSKEAADQLHEALTTLKNEAKDAENYELAAVYKQNLDRLEAINAKTAQLEKAVEEEDFALASRLKNEIESEWAILTGAKAETPSPAPKVVAPQGQTNTARFIDAVRGKPVKRTRPLVSTSKAAGPANSTTADVSISRFDVGTLNISNLQLGESVTLTGQTGTYLNLTSTPLTGMGEYLSEHGTIAGLNVGMGTFDPAGAGYTLNYMSLHLGAGYGVSVDNYTAFATLELTALYWSVLDPDFAGEDAVSNFAAFPQGGAALRLGVMARPFFKENASKRLGSKYRTFHAFVDAPLSGGQGAFMLGYTTTWFR